MPTLSYQYIQTIFISVEVLLFLVNMNIEVALKHQLIKKEDNEDYFWKVFSRECTTSMGSPATVSINYDFSTSKSTITLNINSKQV